MVDKVSDEDQLALDHAIERSRLEVVLQSLQGLDMHPTISHKILHIHSDENTFQSITIMWASKWVQDQVIMRACEKEALAVKLFIKSSEGIGDIAVFRGNLYEPMCHSIIMRGRTFRLRELGSSNSPKVHTLPRCSRMCYFQTLDEVLGFDDGVYLKPESRTHGAVDALIQPDILLQVTLSEVHPISGRWFLRAVQALKSSSKARLLFVVPEESFLSFKRQRIVNAKKSPNPISEADMTILEKVPQFALQIVL